MLNKPSNDPSASQPIRTGFPRAAPMSAVGTPAPVYSEEEELIHVRIFIRKLVEAFLASSDAARTRFNLSTDLEPAHSWNLFFHAQRPDLGDSILLERSLKQLVSLHRFCLEDSADRFARLLINSERLPNATHRTRINAALETDANGGQSHPASVSTINVANAFRALRIVAAKFKAQVEPARRGSYQDSVLEKWQPDWRCQGVVWALIKRLGTITPPPILSTPYQELKEAAFACLFERDYIDKQWNMCSFKNTVLKYIPRPYNWDADLSWLGVSFFVALPLTGFVQVLYNAGKLPTLGSRAPQEVFRLKLYWALFFTIFFSTAVGMILFYSAYRSSYSIRLMQRAAKGTSYELKYTAPPQPGVLRRVSTVHENMNKLQRHGANQTTQSANSDSLDLADLDEVITDSSDGRCGGPLQRSEAEAFNPVPPTPRPPAQSAPALYIPSPTQSLPPAPFVAPIPPLPPPAPSVPAVPPTSLLPPTSSLPPLPRLPAATAGASSAAAAREPQPVIEASLGSTDARLEKVSSAQAAEIQAFFETDEYEPYMRNRERSAMSPDRAIGFGDDVAGSGLSSASLRLYQASMFVQRIYGSTYFDESWAFGLSEAQLDSAIRIILQTDSTLGRQYAAFSFAAIAVASRGVPTIATVTPAANVANAAELTVKRLAQFNFGMFSFLGALTFVSGLTAAVLSDLILRQMSFTQISREGTAHFFAKRFGFFIRVVGGLNSSAGMFLCTSVIHFLLNIFKVNPFAVIVLAAAWLILGTMVMDAFFSNYHFWRMSEILDDVTLIAEPDVLSPSPITGVLQFIMAQLRKIRLPRSKRRDSKRRAEEP